MRLKGSFFTIHFIEAEISKDLKFPLEVYVNYLNSFENIEKFY